MAAVQPPPGQQRSWNYSVPVGSEGNEPAKGSSQNEATAVTHSHRHAFSSHANGPPSYSSSRSEASQQRPGGDLYNYSRPGVTSDSGLLPPPPSVLGRKDSNVSGGGSEPDSLLDLYGTTPASRSAVGSMDLQDVKANGTSFPEDDDAENSRWIHRDKLARIESEELQRAGIRIGRESPTGARSARRERIRDDQAPKEVPPREEKRQRVASPAPGEGLADEEDGAPMSFDLRTPEEAAADPYESKHGTPQHEHTRWPGHNPSYSRIPLPKSSPLPIPQDYIERHTPLHRKSSGEEQSIAYTKNRSRSQSMGSQVLLDDVEHPRTTTPTPMSKASPQASPTKAKAPGGAPGSGTRKGSVSRPGQPKPLTRPAANREPPGTRPTTRSGEVKRPEGEPPWLAGMYKPDPRLPPDQQLLPTVAKRLQQEQWQREGKFGDAYDRELNPMNVTDLEKREEEGAASEEEAPAEALEVPDATRNGDTGEWPLRRLSRGSAVGSTNGGGEHAGYKTMPSVSGGRAASPSRGQASTPIQSLRVQEGVIDVEAGPGEKGKKRKKEKGGGPCGACCMVM
ncbi:MAG: hypothetical protein M1832_005958 [Thelocarpon impressellum]|nr:MAG: hypothetical protein M1832_005958 [Thelocarpon impressellum]